LHNDQKRGKKKKKKKKQQTTALFSISCIDTTRGKKKKKKEEKSISFLFTTRGTNSSTGYGSGVIFICIYSVHTVAANLQPLLISTKDFEAFI